MKDKLIVYLDIDGVLVDWLDGIRKFAGLPEHMHRCFHDNPDLLSERAVNALYGEAWIRKINFERPAEFWLNLKKFSWADRLINALADEYEVVFFSSPGDNPNAGQGKIQWQQKYYPNIPLILGKHKHLAASENKVLIDDNAKKVESFIRYGGMAIIWPSQFLLFKKTADEIDELICNTIKSIENYRGWLELKK